MKNSEIALFFVFLCVILYIFVIHPPPNTPPPPSKKIVIISREENDTEPSREDSRKNPLLEYQRNVSRGRDPVELGDPIRPNMGSIGPSWSPYDYGKGPYPGKNLHIPVPQGSLKMTNEEYKYPFYYQQKPLAPYDFFKPYGPNVDSMQNGLMYADDPFYTNSTGAQNSGRSSSVPFIGSVSSFAPFAEVQTPWEKAGILTRLNEEEIINVYRRSIAPVNDIFDYMVQDKDGFMIPLKRTFLEDGDIVEYIPGKGGPWRVHIYVNNKWIWV